MHYHHHACESNEEAYPYRLHPYPSNSSSQMTPPHLICPGSFCWEISRALLASGVLRHLCQGHHILSATFLYDCAMNCQCSEVLHGLLRVRSDEKSHRASLCSAARPA